MKMTTVLQQGLQPPCYPINCCLKRLANMGATRQYPRFRASRPGSPVRSHVRISAGRIDTNPE